MLMNRHETTCDIKFTDQSKKIEIDVVVKNENIILVVHQATGTNYKSAIPQRKHYAKFCPSETALNLHQD